ncbi:MAG: hypothetical protein PHQ35_09470 [Phycisphaerae bacterium]|nr:hypothetical protein [Phycisphaerae bacterium]MDD5239946.1 hypothetical protein [Candidatus Nanoarchaeia archaeon]
MTVREKALERLIMKESWEIICEKKKSYTETLNHLNECITSEGCGVINSISESKVNEYAKISQKLLLLNKKGIDVLMNMDCFEL